MAPFSKEILRSPRLISERIVQAHRVLLEVEGMFERDADLTGQELQRLCGMLYTLSGTLTTASRLAMSLECRVRESKQ